MSTTPEMKMRLTLLQMIERMEEGVGWDDLIDEALERLLDAAGVEV